MSERLRAFRPTDAPATYDLFHTAIHKGTAPHYSPDQAQAWAPDPTMPAGWLEKFRGSTTWVAEDGLGLAGFLTLRSDGYIDLIFVRPDRRGTGTAQRLLDAATNHARTHRMEMSVHASLLAQPFFTRQGWTTHHREEVQRGDQTLTRFFMTAPRDGISAAARITLCHRQGDAT